MRYEKVDNHLQLAFEMQAARGGLSLPDIQERFKCSRRTAMRMKDAILRNFPLAEEVGGDDRLKRWRIPAGTMDRLTQVSTEELAALEYARKLLDRNNREDDAAVLNTLAKKLKALLKPDVARKVEPDLEALLEAEGLAMRPGPRPRISDTVREDLRNAIKACRKVRLKYMNRKTRKVNERLVHPYGFLHGHRHYLVAFHENPKANNVVLFSLPNIRGIDICGESFVRDPAFNLQKYAERSFGLFQEEPYDVVWKFHPDAVNDAQDFIFHPSQTQERQKDGSLIVRFHAGGDLEMAWHLYTWGDKVEVLAPKKLADMVNKRRVAWDALP